MAVRPIVLYPDPGLRVPGKPVTDFGPEFQQLVDDMIDSMYAASGVGLAAQQIGVAKRLFISDCAIGEDEPSDLRVFANPEILLKEGSIMFEEGCLSFPDIREDIERATHVIVRAQDRQGNTFELDAHDLQAIAVQHELDHIEGRLMIDHVSPLKQRMIEKAMRKLADEKAVAAK